MLLLGLTNTKCPKTLRNSVLVVSFLLLNISVWANPPFASPDSAIVPENVSAFVIDVQANDIEIEQLVMVTTILQNSQKGGFAIVLNDDSISYSAPIDFLGKDTIVYQVCNSNGECDFDTLILNISIPNKRPIILARDSIVLEDAASTLCLAHSDEDINTVFTFRVDSVSKHWIDTIPYEGVFQIDTNCVEYTPLLNYFGEDTIWVTVCDEKGACAQTTIILHIQGVNDAPVATPDTLIVAENNAGIVINVQGNDWDVDGDTLETLIIKDSLGIASSVKLLNKDSILYKPAPNTLGLDTIIYLIRDKDFAYDIDTVFIDVSIPNKAPIVETHYEGTIEDTPVSLCMDYFDFDGDTVSFTADCFVNGGTYTVSQNCIIYHPAWNFNGLDSICVIGCDEHGACDTAKAYINVAPANDGPVILDSSKTILEDTPDTICLSIYDEEGDVLSFTVGCVDNALGSIEVLNDSCFVYSPKQDVVGTDTICAMICENGGPCDTAYIQISISPVNDPPVISTPAFPFETVEDSSITICVEFFDIDDTSHTLTVACLNLGGTITDIDSSCFVYTPAANFIGTDTICATICDTSGACSATKIIVVVSPADDAPFPQDTTINVTENTTVVTCIQVNEVDGDAYDITIGCNNNGAIVSNSGVCISYKSVQGFIGNDTLCIMACDINGGKCDTSLFIVTVNPVNDNPIIIDTNFVVPEDSSFAICPRFVDPDPGDTSGFTVSGICSTAGSTFSFSNDSCVTYTPAFNFNGEDTVCIVVCDRWGACDTAEFIVELTPVNDIPFITDTVYYTKEDSSFIFCLNGTDYDSDDVTYVVTCQDTTAGLINSLDCFVYIPNPATFGDDTLCVEVCDSLGCTNSFNVIIRVEEVKRKPVVFNDTLYTNSDDAVFKNVLLNDDLSREYPEFSLAITPLYGRAYITEDTILNYEPLNEPCGIDSLYYKLCNSTGCDTGMVYIKNICTDLLVAPEGFSPNGDGKNDAFEIVDLELYPENELTIYNRWGQIVYRAINYQNDWTGNAGEGVELNAGTGQLPESTYYFILKVRSEKGEAEKEFQGEFYLNL